MWTVGRVMVAGVLQAGRLGLTIAVADDCVCCFAPLSLPLTDSSKATASFAGISPLGIAAAHTEMVVVAEGKCTMWMEEGRQ